MLASSKRRYKDAWDPQDVLAEIARGSGTHFDPALVDAFLEFAFDLTGKLQASFAREETPVASELSPA